MKKTHFFREKTTQLRVKIPKPKVKIVTLFLTLFCCFINFAFESDTVGEYNHNEGLQDFIVSGTVSGTNGPIPGVNILVKGTSVGTQTDFDGKYSLNIRDNNAVLIFSYIGYATQEIVVENKDTINVTLEEDAGLLDEIIVVGYGSKKRGEVTGSISTLKAEDIENTSNREVAKSLAGRVTGLIVSDRGGLPGSNNDVTLLIRGQATLNNNAPLILIDGIPAGIGTFNQLSPQDIENVSVLKDGAAAVYGNRAANGVILVTSKRGKSGKLRINASTSYSVSTFSSKPDLTSSAQYAIYENEIADRFGNALPFSQSDIDNFASGSDPVNFPNTNWFDATFASTAPESRNSISLSGGTEKANYFVSLDNLQREGLFDSGDTDFKQNQIRSNIDINITDDLKFSVDLSGRFAKNRAPGVPVDFIYKHIYTNFPTELAVFPNGLPARGGENGANPLIMSSRTAGFNDDKTNDLRGRLAIDWKLDRLTEGLSLNAYAGLRRILTSSKDFYNPWTYYVLNQTTNELEANTGFSQQGSVNILRETSFEFDETLLNASLRYKRTFGSAHSVSGLVAFEQITTETSTFFAQANNLPTDQLPFLFAGDPETAINGGNGSELALLSYFGTLSYDYDKRYFMDLTIRRDGSSRFGSGQRFGTFYSVGGNWALGNEKFMENVSWLNALNIKGSYSVMGNDRITPFQFLSQFTFGNNNPNAPRPNYYVFGESGAVFNGFRTGVAPNPNVTWETAKMSNIALVFSMFDSRLSGEVNFYKQVRSDILVPNANAVPDFTGVVLPDENLGRVDSEGVEITLGWADTVGEVSYNLGFNLTQAQNEVVFLPQPENLPERQDVTGFRIGSYVVAPTNGIFANQTQVDNAAATIEDTVEGEPFYQDVNNDGVIDNRDWIRINTSNIPEIQYGITGGVNYKNVNLNFLLQGQAKAKALVYFDQIGSKPEHVFTDRWTPNNRGARYPRAFGLNDQYSGPQDNNNSVYADLWYHDASFLRLKELEIGYTLSKEKTTFADIKLFARGFNLLTMFSDIQKLGLDPEASGYNNFRDSTYPSLKTYTFGMNFTF
ncbi:SusC/RagA family TonB-linked outer membrane protein [Aquimarina aggregata]|uniref:SusC/RagA family TonB-linked outer membrane protein n=1 Tax=Aquimarina aggregata TaxID=1642818 RepID=A0A162XYX1_9FLAO|nr:TonB-dependent receptor [Aquimarina aggregata]KZS38843.1 SusC/RagA family TonB-linked outer membrane protein [Aquimarina aggregata]